MSIQLNFYLKIYLDSQEMGYAVWIFKIYSCKFITLGKPNDPLQRQMQHLVVLQHILEHFVLKNMLLIPANDLYAQ